jgi:uncharacterized protein YjbI with pentapeptide repeats
MSTIKMNDCEHTFDITNANLRSSRFEDVNLAETTFEAVTLEAANFKDVHMDCCVLDTVSLAGSTIRNGKYEGMTIDGIDVNAMLSLFRAQQADAVAGH